MKNSKVKKKKNRDINYNQLGLLVITVIVLLFLVTMVLQSRKLEVKLAVYDAKAATLEEDIESENARTEEIEALREYMKTDDYAEEVARERLGLVKENETVFKEEKDINN